MTPPVIESLKVLAGIANTERISEDTKKKTEAAILTLIRVIENQAVKMANDNSMLFTP